MSDNFGYQSDEACEVCGQHKNNQSESRFLYTVCEDHQDISPVNVNKYQYERRNIAMQKYIGRFTVEDMENRIDQKQIAEEKLKTGLQYVNTELVMKNGKVVAMKVWLCGIEDFKL